MLIGYESKPHSSICVNLALKYVKICRNAVGYIFEKRLFEIRGKAGIMIKLRLVWDGLLDNLMAV